MVMKLRSVLIVWTNYLFVNLKNEITDQCREDKEDEKSLK